MWVVIASGLVSSGLYIAISLGVVLTFRFAHVLNFAQGAIATLCGYAAWQLVGSGLSIWGAWAVAIAVGALTSLVFGLIIGRYLADAPELLTAMATFGPALAIMGIVGEVWGQNPKALPTPSILDGTVEVAGATVGRFELSFLVWILALVGLLSIGLQRSRVGLALRAVADDPATAAVNGVNVVALERLAWAAAGAVAGMAGVAISISAQLDPNYLTTFMIAAFTAVVLGGIGTFAGLVVGCLVYGVILALVSFYVGPQYEAITALVLLTILYMVRPTGLLGHQTLVASNGLPAQSDSTGGRWVTAMIGAAEKVRAAAPDRVRARTVAVPAALVVVFVLVVVLPRNLDGSFVFVLATAIAMAVAVAGQNVASGMSGRLAVAQGGFMMVGGYCTGLLVSEAGASPLVAVVGSLIVGLAFGAVIGASIIRLSGIYLGILTLQFTLAVPELAKAWTGLTRGELGIVLPSLDLIGWTAITPYDIWIATALLTAIALGALGWFSRAKIGMKIRAARDADLGAESIGLDVRWLRVAAIAVSGGGGALAGSLSSLQSGIITPESFGIWTSVTILLAAAIAGQNSVVVGPLVGASFIVLLPYLLASQGGWSSIIFGFGALGFLVIRRLVARAHVMAARTGHEDSDSGDAPPKKSSDHRGLTVGRSRVSARHVPRRTSHQL
ncbi:ABC transporter permease [Gordonia sp. ABSL11-1]|uniref:ABC transporter permease n=1 Tax=Gordonia sp. ABSL11-1 TaxID=3053924 RepID=UPI0025732F75|nr:ABC transporter permease [Gordonia sp. ABSL11-1]MDL9948958.1 ABC transporter permease [Gordonia sp. ABSL11-1]